MRWLAVILFLCATGLPIVGMLLTTTKEHRTESPPITARVRRLPIQWAHPLDN